MYLKFCAKKLAIQSVNDLYSWKSNGTSVAEGSFLKEGGVPTFFYVAVFTDIYNGTHAL
jgi:hypothetical protein